MAVLTGGQVISEDVGLKLEKRTLDLLELYASRVIITKDATTVVDGGGSRRRRHRPCQPDQGRDQENTDSPNWDREKLCKSASPSWPAALPSSRSARRPRSNSRRRSTASKTPCRQFGVHRGGCGRRCGTALIRARPAVQVVVDSLEGDEQTGARLVAVSLTASASEHGRRRARGLRSWW